MNNKNIKKISEKIEILKNIIYLIFAFVGIKNYKKLEKKKFNNYLKKNFPITFIDHKEDEEIIKKIFEKFPTESFNLYNKNRKFLKDAIAAPGVMEQSIIQLNNILKKNSKANKLLSIGCGSEKSLQIFDLLGFESYGVDIEIVEETNRIKWHNLNENIDLPFEEKSFDIILCEEVIEHIENPWLLFRKVKRILKSNGIFILTTPNVNSLNSRMGYVQNLEGWTTNFREDMLWYHINPLHYFELKHIIKYNNFEIINITGNNEYFVNFKEDSEDLYNIVNRNDILHFILKKNDDKIKIYNPCEKNY